MKKLGVRIPNNWKPRFDQLQAWRYLEAGGTRAVEVAHRRWGKDDVALHMTAKKACTEVGNYWHMLPKYIQARKVVWDAINPRTGMRRIDEAFPEHIRQKTRRQDMSIELINGSIWQLVGSDNYNNYVGSPPRGIVLSEWAISNPMAWAFLAPILEENGGWAFFIYTSRGNNHGRTTYEHALEEEDWFAEKLSALDTPVFTDKQLNNIKKEYIRLYGYDLGIALFEQEYYCSFRGAVLGAYYAQQMEEARVAGRIGSLPWTKGQEVFTFWDLGVDDSMSVWFMQLAGSQYHFIDYYEATGYGLKHYAKILAEKGYTYGGHYMPHDAESREMTNNEIALSRKQVAEGLGLRPIHVVSRARNMDLIINVHIPAVRNVLESCCFDEQKCRQGIACLENYSAKYDEDKKILGTHPDHTWASHGSDAFRTFGVGWGAINNPFGDA